MKQKILLPLLILLGLSACDDSADSIASDPEITVENGSDSLLEDLTAEQQYNQHFIFDIPNEFQSFQDSLTNWVVNQQPGGLRFNDWDSDVLAELKMRWDTLNMVQPLYCIDYFDHFDLPSYPFWQTNDRLRDSVWFQLFQSDRIGLVDFGDKLEGDTILNSWITDMQNQIGLSSAVASMSDKNVQQDLIRFLTALRSDVGAIKLKLLNKDTTSITTYRKRANYTGLIIAETSRDLFNQQLIRGVDLIHIKSSPFVSGKLPFNEWDLNKNKSADFKQSTKRILNYKNQLNAREIRPGSAERIESYKIQNLYRSSALISNDQQLFPIKEKLTVYTSEKVRIDKKIGQENPIRFNHSKINENIDQIIKKETLKCIVLPDTLSQKVKDVLSKEDPFDNTLFCFSEPGHFELVKNKANIIYLSRDRSGNLNWNIVVQQLTGRLALTGNFIHQNKRIQGVQIPKSQLSRTNSLFVGLSQDTLRKIDYAVRNAISGRAFPGCQVLAVKDGNIIYDKSFGHHTYDRQQLVDRESMYDIASLTKVVSTTLMAMKLYELEAYDFQDSLKDYLPDTLRKYLKFASTIRNITFQELLVHKSGMPAGFPILPYMQYTNEEVGRFDKYFCDLPDTVFTIEVAENFYLEECYKDSMWLRLNRIWLDPSKPYKYSDVNMNTLYFIFKSIIENDPRKFGFKEPLKELEDRNLYEAYLYREFYKKLGMLSTLYKPRDHVNKNRLVPTENERYWRKQLLQGYVHDPNAALYGGIAGNAGIFSTTNDLAILGQMWLNGGVYNGVRYIKKETVDHFTKAQPDSHRGLGFNKPSLNTSAFGCADSAPPETYGHTGFTGTCIWIDPVNNITFVFLSNRVHPKVNNRIYNYGIRGNAHQYVYDAHLFQEF